jgi:hypothetical protein
MMRACPRCGREVKGFGKTSFCQPCAAHFAAAKVYEAMMAKPVSKRSRGWVGKPGHGKQRPSLRPVTLPPIKGG